MSTNLNRLRSKMEDAQRTLTGDVLIARYKDLIYSAYTGMRIGNRYEKTMLVIKYGTTIDTMIELMQELAYL